MSRSLTSNKKSRKFLSIVYQNKQGKVQNAFLKSYSQLINSHLNINKKQKQQNRRISSSSHGFRTKSHKNLNSYQTDAQKNPQNNILTSKTQLLKCFELTQNDNQRSIRSSSKMLINPQKRQLIQRSTVSKSQQVQLDSYKNVALNVKLQQSNKQKNNLLKQIQDLKRQIANQKKKKSKISIQMGKLMNKNEQSYNNLMKVGKQRNQIQVQIEELKNSNERREKKNNKLKDIFLKNSQKIQIQQKLVQFLQQKVVKEKIAFSQTKTHLNQLKSIHTYQCKLLTKVRMNAQALSEERDKLFNVVHSSVYPQQKNYKK